MGDAAHPSFQLENHVFFWITQVLDARNRRLARELKALNLRVTEWRVLASLFSRQNLSMGQLADLSSIDRTTLSRTVDRMVKAGWVFRISDASDNRITRLRLTSTGQDLFDKVWPLIERANHAASKTLPESAVGMVCWVLSEMRNNLVGPDGQLEPDETNRVDSRTT